MSRDANVQVETGQGQITYICFLLSSCLDSLLRRPPEQPTQTAMTPGPDRGRQWLQDQAKGSDLHLWHLLGQEGWGACLRSSRLSPQLLLRGTSPALATWPQGAGCSLPFAVPRKKHHWKQETRNKSVLPSWTSPQDHQLTPTYPFQRHLHRAAAALLGGSLPHTSAAVRSHWLTAGTATRKARGWGADLPRKASGAWLGLCETPIKPSSPDAFNCLIPRWS